MESPSGFQHLSTATANSTTMPLSTTRDCAMLDTALAMEFHNETSFTLFAKLPVKIRRLIWEYAQPAPRILCIKQAVDAQYWCSRFRSDVDIGAKNQGLICRLDRDPDKCLGDDVPDYEYAFTDSPPTRHKILTLSTTRGFELHALHLRLYTSVGNYARWQ